MKEVRLIDKKFLWKETIKNGIINFVINGVIQYFLLRENTKIPLTLDSISDNEVNIADSSISIAITISLILTIITYFTLKVPKIPLIPSALWLTIKNTFLAFMTLTAFSVLWQKYMGSIEVSLITAVLIIAIISGIVAAIVAYITIDKCVLNQIEDNKL